MSEPWTFAEAAGVPLGEGEVLVWWLGQAGFLLRGGGKARGIVGNMSAEEAVGLAVGAGAEVLVPMHWDMFERNPGHPSRAVALTERDHPELTVIVPSRARPIGLRPLRAGRTGVA